MQIKKLEIVSFGKLHNETISFNNRFNYFYGPNEAGKTTIRMFITYVLFGLKKDERDRYISKYDGQLGGRLHIKIDERDWIIERFLHRNNGKPIIYENEIEVTEEQLQKALKSIDRFLFESIFSFQDRDLQAIREQTPESIGKVLFNLGMTGSDQIAEVEKMLKKEKDDLFKLRGRNQPIYLKLKELDELTKQIKELEEREQSYLDFQRRQLNEEERINQLANLEKSLNEKSQYYQKLMGAKSAIIDYQLYKEQLSNYDEAKHFSKEVIDKFNHLQEEIFELKKDYEVRKGRLDQLNEELKSLNVRTEYSVGELNDFTNDLLSANQLISQLNELTKEINNEQHLLNDLLQEASLTFTKEEIEQLNVNLYTENHWKKLNDDYERFNEELQSIDSKILVVNDEKGKIHQEIISLKENMLREEVYEELKEKENQWRNRNQLASLQRNVIREWKDRIKQLNKEKQLIKTLKPSITIVTVLLLVIYFLFFTNNTIDYFVLLSILVVGTMTIFLISRRGKRNRGETKRLKEMLGQFSNEENINFSENEMKLIKEYEEKKETLNGLNLKLDYTESTLREIIGEKSAIVQRQQKLQLQIEKVINDYPFLGSFELFQWPNVHQTLNKAKQIVKKITDLENNYFKLKSKLKEKEEFAHSFVSLFNEVERKAGQSIWDFWKQCLEEEKQLKEQLNEKKKWIDDLKEQIHDIETSLKPYEKELKQLFSNLRVENEEQFLKRSEQYEQYVSLIDKKEQSKKIVFSMFGEQVMDVLTKTYDWVQIDLQVKELTEEIEQCKEDYKEARQTLSNITAEMNQLEKDGTLSEFLHKRAVLVEEIKQLAKTYAIYAVAEGYLDETRERYQNVYLPEIVHYATKFFSKITDGVYKQIRFSTEDETIYVENARGDWFTVKQLSEGTSDQLYVSLRLAINTVLNDFLYVPFILDDAFNHFDHERKSRMLSLLNEISERQQIIYLTCTELTEESIV